MGRERTFTALPTLACSLQRSSWIDSASVKSLVSTSSIKTIYDTRELSLILLVERNFTTHMGALIIFLLRVTLFFKQLRRDVARMNCLLCQKALLSNDIILAIRAASMIERTIGLNCAASSLVGGA